MPSNVKAAMDAWRLAEAHARETEAAFEKAFADFTQRRGPEPSTELLEVVAQSRKRANALLSELISLLAKEIR